MAAKRKTGTSVLEWVTGAVGLVVALGLLGIMVWQAATGRNDDLPNLVVEAGRMEAATNGYAVEFEVRNRSDRTAAAVVVVAVLRRAGQEVETGTATIDYVPARSGAKGGFQFANDPRLGTLEMRATNYQLP